MARGLTDKARTIRIPVHVVEKLNRIIRSERRLRAELYREPTPAEIAEGCGAAGGGGGADPADARRHRCRWRRRSGTSEESEFGHFLADENMPLPADAAESVSRTTALRNCLDSLGDRERQVLELRYGLDGGARSTLEEVGVVFNVTASVSARSRPSR